MRLRWRLGRVREREHVDVIANRWLSGYQELVERIEPDDPRASRDGSHMFASEPHLMKDCPFKDADRIHMVPVSVAKME